MLHTFFTGFWFYGPVKASYRLIDSVIQYTLKPAVAYIHYNFSFVYGIIRV